MKPLLTAVGLLLASSCLHVPAYAVDSACLEAQVRCSEAGNAVQVCTKDVVATGLGFQKKSEGALEKCKTQNAEKERLCQAEQNACKYPSPRPSQTPPATRGTTTRAQ